MTIILALIAYIAAVLLAARVCGFNDRAGES